MIKYTKDNVPSVQDERRYKPALCHRVIELKVTVMLDAVPGAWHEPDDIMKYIAAHNYVQSVDFIQEIDNDSNAPQIVADYIAERDS